MSPESYSWEIRETAEELYIIDGLTYDEVAGRTSVSVSQLKRWGTESMPTWSERRREYRQAQTSVRRGVMLAKAKLIESVIQSEDPQKAYAFSALVGSGKTIDQEARERAAAQNTVPDMPDMAGAQKITSAAEAVAALQAAVQNKINSMVTRPGELSFAAIKDTKAALEMIEQLQNKYVPTEETVASGGLSDDAAEIIRRQILGLSK